MEIKLKFSFYDHKEFVQFLNQLFYKDRDKLLLTINNIETMGIPIASRMKWTKKLGNNLYEIRSKRSTNIQRCLYFQVIDNQYVVTNAFTKKTNKTPRREIRKAINRRNQYLKMR